jgi:hypothetical protein
MGGKRGKKRQQNIDNFPAGWTIDFYELKGDLQ